MIHTFENVYVPCLVRICVHTEQLHHMVGELEVRCVHIYEKSLHASY